MDFFVNGQNFDITIEDEKTIGDVLKSFQIYCDENDAAVIGIKINENLVTADNFDDVKTQELNDSTKFEFNIITKANISESFQKLSELFTELATRMEQIPVDLQTGNENNARIAIKNLADNIDDFCHIARLATLFQEYKSIEIDGAECSRASLHNISIMQEVLGLHPYKGQKIWVYKANAIIPQISRAEKEENI